MLSKLSARFLVLFCLMAFYGNAQTIDTLWFNSKWEPSSKEGSTYHRTIQKTSRAYLVTDFFNTGETQMSGNYTSLDPQVREGLFKWWYKDGKKRSEILYRDNVAQKETHWDTNGKITDQYEVVTADHIENGKSVTEKVSIEVMPMFEGGMPAVYKYVGDHFNYPSELEKDRPHGKVVVQFTVNKKGRVVDVVVLQGLHPLLDQEAVRVIKSMPNWKAGIQNGEPVNVKMKLPIGL